ncbi:hypothetical protein JNUCC1_03691 [Lentibacillus sp. JNUCC-1]|uniref:DUF1798 family protein n=1 Tax=Lentibacillus sp. JNUCC-1 TaxID=2654513 RepID=UPI0012E94553|nr:DUF1798 family protein [Lentibacillus sp. JNUCC-1]MUV39807.1 hypothetical protein [Lentibacillus sp. JNUCC-1]
MSTLRQLTIQLKQKLERLKKMYEENEPPESIKDKQFFLHMKEETAPVYEELAQWEERVLDVVKEQRINLHPQQITSTKENMELVILHSYYIDAREKRYMELYKSILYIFDQLLRSLETLQHDDTGGQTDA